MFMKVACKPGVTQIQDMDAGIIGSAQPATTSIGSLAWGLGNLLVVLVSRSDQFWSDTC